jgi:hypothetical protein
LKYGSPAAKLKKCPIMNVKVKRREPARATPHHFAEQNEAWGSSLRCERTGKVAGLNKKRTSRRETPPHAFSDDGGAIYREKGDRQTIFNFLFSIFYLFA